MSEPLVRLDRVSRTFRGRVAVDDVSLAVCRGEVLALLGPNGAGKSTLLALMLGHLPPSAGQVFLRGVSVVRRAAEARRGVGVVLERPAFHDHLSGWENIELLAGYSGRPDPATMRDAVGFVGLEGCVHDRVRTYSRGMRQRLALAQALVPVPELLLLDEPGAGLDPEGTETMMRLIVRLRRERAMTVVLASHQLAEVEPVCDRVVILDRGRVAFNGACRPGDGALRRVRLEVDDWPQARAVLDALGVRVVEVGIVELAPGGEVADVVSALVGAGRRVEAVTPVVRTLAAVYRRAVASDSESKP